MDYRKLNRNTKPATMARVMKADETARKAYEEIVELHEQGASLEEMSAHLIDCGIKSPRGNYRWDRTQVSRIIKRVKERNLYP